jgi:glyoxylase-like metal-dependent hydrolase (beta-lactamase superfamily II)
MIHRLAIPTGFRIGSVNCYLVEDDPLTLVDCGPKSDEALAELEAALARHGRRIEDLERVVITHQHLDHMGLAATIVRRSGAEVCALDRLAPWLADFAVATEADDAYSIAIMARHGIEPSTRSGLRSVSSRFHDWGEAVRVTNPVPDGGELQFADRTWQVHHRPGHSPSDTVFHDAASNELVVGDHLLKSISSNPIISRPLEGGDPADRPRTLMLYIESMKATRAMEVSVALGGHGEEIDDHRALIDKRLASTERRAEKIHALIAERPRTAPELARELWGGDIAMTQAYLTLSEVLGHTDILEAAGRVREEPSDSGAVRFSAV